MCWPVGENSHFCVEAMRSSRNVSASDCRANSPRRFTHGPRLVETVTSGEVVTMRVRKRAAGARDLVENPAEADLRRDGALRFGGEPVRHRDARRMPATLALRRRRGRSARTASDRVPGRRDLRTHPIRGLRRTFIMSWKAPSDPWSSARRGCPCGRQAAGPTLDRIGDEAGRPVVAARRLEGLDQARQISGRRDWSSARRVPHPSGARSAPPCRALSPISSSRRLRQAAPPWKVSAE